MDPSEPESLIYSLGIFGSKDPHLGSFFVSLHPGTGGTQARPYFELVLGLTPLSVPDSH